MTTGRINQVCGMSVGSMRSAAARMELHHMNKLFTQSTILGCIGNWQVCDQHEAEQEINF